VTSSQLGLFELEDPAPKPPKAYFVRSHQSPAEVAEGERRANLQEAAILDFFRALGRGRRMTPSDVYAAIGRYEGPNRWPLTSIRRAMTCLTRRGLLLHWPGERRLGPMGRNESCWSLPEEPSNERKTP
jgi:hypothetical protein